MAKPLLVIHPGHPLHPGDYDIIGKQSEQDVGPRIPLRINGNRVGTIVAHYRCVTAFTGGGSTRNLSGAVGNYWEDSTDTYPTFIAVPNVTGNPTTRSVPTSAGTIEPIIVFTLANPGRGVWGGDWFTFRFTHNYTATGVFTFDKIILLPPGA